MNKTKGTMVNETIKSRAIRLAEMAGKAPFDPIVDNDGTEIGGEMWQMFVQEAKALEQKR